MSVSYLCYQGEFYRSDRPFMGLNRAFKYGDGCFETMRSFGENIPFLSFHFHRLKSTLQFLRIEFDEDFIAEVQSALIETIRKNELQNGSRLRLTVFRRGGGRYQSEEDRAAYLIEIEPASSKFELNTKGLSIELSKNVLIYPSPYTSMKLIGSPTYILAAKEKVEQKKDDLLICNPKGEIAEATYSNLFIVKNKTVLTPPISSGCLNGVMRAKMFEIMPLLGHTLSEKELSTADVESADEVFLTNAISPVTWVSSFRTHRYFKKLSQHIVDYLNKNLL